MNRENSIEIVAHALDGIARTFNVFCHLDVGQGFQGALNEIEGKILSLAHQMRTLTNVDRPPARTDAEPE